MFSSRRYSPRYKSRQYYKKKNINRKFSPAAYKNNIPTYYQQKGRIIQTSPLHLYSVPRQLPNSETLKNMYDTLLKVNYPNVGPNPTPQMPLQPYLVSFALTAAEINTFTEDGKLTPTKFQSLVSISTELSNLPEGWGYKFELYTIEFRQRIGSGLVESNQYHIDLTHPIFVDNPYSIVIKTVSTTGSNNTNIIMMTSLIPVQPYEVKLSRLAFTTQGYTITNPTLTSDDADINDNGWYPILSNSYPDEQNFLEIVLNSGRIPDDLYMLFNVLCTPVQL